MHLREQIVGLGFRFLLHGVGGGGRRVDQDMAGLAFFLGQVARAVGLVERLDFFRGHLNGRRQHVDRQLHVFGLHLFGDRVFGRVGSVIGRGLFGGDFHLCDELLGGDIHHGNFPRLLGRAQVAGDAGGRGNAGVGDAVGELRAFQILAQLRFEHGRRLAAGLEECFVARRHELAFFLERGFAHNALAQRRIAHPHAGDLRCLGKQALVDQLVEYRLAHLRVIHDRGVDARAELALELLELATHRFVEFGRGDFLATDRGNGVLPRRGPDVRLNPPQGKGNGDKRQDHFGNPGFGRVANTF